MPPEFGDIAKTAFPALHTGVSALGESVRETTNKAFSRNIADQRYDAGRGTSPVADGRVRLAAAKAYLQPAAGGSVAGADRTLTRIASESESAVDGWARKVGARNYMNSFGSVGLLARGIGYAGSLGGAAAKTPEDRGAISVSAALGSLVALQLASVLHTQAGIDTARNAHDLLASSSRLVDRTGQTDAMPDNWVGNAFRPFGHLLAAGNTAVTAIQAGLLFAIERSDADEGTKDSLRAGVGALGVVLPYAVGQAAAHHTVRNVAAAQIEAGLSLAEPLRDAAGRQIGEMITHKTPADREIDGQPWLELGQIDLPLVPETADSSRPGNADTPMASLSILVSPDGAQSRILSAEIAGDDIPNIPSQMPPNMRHPDVDSNGTVTRGVFERMRSNIGESFRSLNSTAAAQTLREAHVVATRASQEVQREPRSGDAGARQPRSDSDLHLAELGWLHRQASSLNDDAGNSIHRVASALSALSSAAAVGDTGPVRDPHAVPAAGAADPIPELPEDPQAMSDELIAAAQALETAAKPDFAKVKSLLSTSAAMAALGQVARGPLVEALAETQGYSRAEAGILANLTLSAISNEELGNDFIPGFMTFATRKEIPAGANALPVAGGRIAVGSGVVDLDGPRLSRDSFAPYAVNKALMFKALQDAEAANGAALQTQAGDRIETEGASPARLADAFLDELKGAVAVPPAAADDQSDGAVLTVEQVFSEAQPGWIDS